jgi:CheY-like chemotaxis protein
MGNIKILVVDDDSDARETVKLILEDRGFEVEEASDGQMGIDAAKASRPDLIIMDAMMPRKDGYVACMEIKRDSTLAQVPIVMLSGVEDHVRGEPGAKNVKSSLEADEFLSKPIEPDKFIQIVDRLLEQ